MKVWYGRTESTRNVLGYALQMINMEIIPACYSGHCTPGVICLLSGLQTCLEFREAKHAIL